MQAGGCGLRGRAARLDIFVQHVYEPCEHWMMKKNLDSVDVDDDMSLMITNDCCW